MALRLAFPRRQPPLSCNLVLCIEKMAFASSSSSSSPACPTAPDVNPPAALDDPPADAATMPPAATPVEEAPAAPCPGDATLAPDSGKAGTVPPADPSHRGPRRPSVYKPTHQPRDP